MSTLNFYTILQERINTNDSDYAWFTAKGMPDIPGLRDAKSYAYEYQLDKNVAAIVRLPSGQAPPMTMLAGGVSMAEWVRDHGWKTYAQFLWTHPEKILDLTHATASKNLSPPSDNFLPITSKTIVPRSIFNPWQLWAGIGIVSLAISLLTAQRRLRNAVIALALTTVIIYVTGVLASGIEVQRHSVTAAVLLRVIALCAVAIATSVGVKKPDEFDGVPS